MVHWSQRERLRNLDLIRGWIKASKDPKNVDREALTHKCMLVLGCTRQKAVEYIKAVYGEE